jgi:hypothetical protein
MNENIITDRTVIDVMSFTKAAKSINYYEAEAFCDLAKNLLPEYDYLFYVSPVGVEMEDNGVRETDLEYREAIDDAIISAMNTFGHRCKNVHMLKGTTLERIEQMLGVIQF